MEIRAGNSSSLDGGAWSVTGCFKGEGIFSGNDVQDSASAGFSMSPFINEFVLGARVLAILVSGGFISGTFSL